MPYKEKICGIYKISTPNGSSYIGSSVNIYRRWAEHRYTLRKGTHHSERLQNAFNKHGDELIFEVIGIHGRDELNVFEQEAINRIKPVLNTVEFIENVWANPATREKFRRIYLSKEFRENRSRISANIKSRWVAVVCSDGRAFKNMASAAREFKTTVSRIKNLAETQTIGKLGVRFRFVGDDWTEEKTQYQKSAESNKGRKHTKESKYRMSLAAKMRPPPSDWIGKKGNDVSAREIIGVPIHGGDVIKFQSQCEAGRYISPETYRTAGAQICKVCKGVKKTAYGYVWRYA